MAKPQKALAIDWEKLDALLVLKDERPGEDWFTSVEFQIKYKIGLTTARRRIKELLKLDAIEVHKAGRCNRTFYRVK